VDQFGLKGTNVWIQVAATHSRKRKLIFHLFWFFSTKKIQQIGEKGKVKWEGSSPH
jgi:hypothetical protein